MIGIYKITNIINGKVYIGKSTNIEKRWNAHRTKLTSFHLCSAIKKYGIDNFEFEVLKEISLSGLTDILLNIYEVKYIKEYKSFDSKYGYNKTYGGDGVKATEETNKKNSESNKKHWKDNDYRKKMSMKVKAALNKPEVRQKLIEAQKRLSNDTDFKKRKSNKMKEKWKDPDFRKMMCEKQSKRTKELWLNEEYRKNHMRK